MRRVQIKLIVLLLAAGSYAQAQHHHHEQQPSKPSELLEGLGNHIHPIATRLGSGPEIFRSRASADLWLQPRRGRAFV